MRILLVHDWPWPEGGTERYLSWVRDGLRVRGHDVRLLVSSAGDGARAADHVAFGTERRAAQALLQIANPLAAATVRRVTRRFRPDVVYVTMFEMNLSPLAVLAAAPCPVVLSFGNYKPVCPTGIKTLPDGSRCSQPAGRICVAAGCTGAAHWLRDRPRYRLIRGTVAGARAVLACSEPLRRQLAESGVEAIHVPWPVPAPPSGFARRPAAVPTFAYVGRLAREKGVDVFVRALADVHARGLPVRAAVIGDGPERPRLERLVAEHDLERWVELTGQVEADRVEDALSEAWALVGPSLWVEPLGLAAIEAIVRRVPVIATEGGGFSETVEPGVTGLLVPPNDAGALAGAISLVAERTAFPDALADAAASERLRARHDLEAHLVTLESILRGAADAGPRNPGR